MKKNLNIAYLNGTDGMIRKIAGGGGSDSGSGDNVNMVYYKISDEIYTVIVLEYAALVKAAFTDGAYIPAIMTASFYKNFIGSPTLKTTLAFAGINGIYSNLNTLEPKFYNWIDYLKESAAIDYPDITDWSFLTPITKEEFYNLETQS